jgi:hypothetical protein
MPAAVIPSTAPSGYPHRYLTTNGVRQRYGTVTVVDGRPKYERSRMWISRRQKLDGFPQAVHLGETSKLNHYLVDELDAWDAANLSRTRAVRS